MTGKQIRMSRVLDPASDSALIVAYSHGILFGPTDGFGTTEEFRANAAIFAEGGATGMMLTPGYLRVCADLLCGPGKPVPIFSLSWSNIWRGPDLLGHEGFKHSHTLIATIEDAVRAGADMVHLYVHCGSADPNDDAEEMRRLGQVVSECERYSIPVLCEPLARGTAVPSGAPNRREYVALMARMAAEVGADMVKVEYTGDAESFATVVETCAVPVVMMGGAKSDRFIDFLTMLEDGMSAGAKGVAVGRNLFLHPSPKLAMKAVRRVVRERKAARVAAEELEQSMAGPMAQQP
jgi:DhnA family fructose-bisphosphate aldolase class Ia